jgi:hypothetical protein
VAASVREAAYSTSSNQPVAQVSMFGGATYRIGFDRRADKVRGRASLNFGGMVKSANSSELRIAQGLEIAGGKSGKPALHLAGQDVGELGNRAKLGTGGTVALVVVGVVVVAAVIAGLAWAEDRKNKNNE